MAAIAFVAFLEAAVVPVAGANDLKVLTLSPVGSHSCVAAPIFLADGEVLTGISWFNNDSAQPFPKLLLMEGQPGVQPDLSQTGLVLAEVSGEELAWGEVTLATPVLSSTGFIYAVWVFPSGATTEGLGDGEGPGIGVDDTPAEAPSYLSADGEFWMEFSTEHSLRVTPVVASGAARTLTRPVVLASLVEGQQYSPSPGGAAQMPVLPSRTGLGLISPNPFNPRTLVHYDLAHPSAVSLRVYDVRGRLIKVLQSGVHPAGAYSTTWLGDDSRGASVASGVYYVRFEGDSEVITKRITLIR